MPLYFGGSGVTPNLEGLPGTNLITLPPGGAWMIPSGWFQVRPGQFTIIQVQDTAGAWLALGAGSTHGSYERVRSDGNNFRLFNSSGCAVGALLTAAGSGYTSPPVVTPSAGGGIWAAVVGGAVGAINVTNGGVGYSYPPIVVVAAPGPGAIKATARAVMSGQSVSSIVVDNQGAGYTSPPVVSIYNDPRDTTGYGATASASLTGAGTVTGVACTQPGAQLTAVPTLAFSGGGGSAAAATAIMSWTITGFTVSGGGGGYAAPVALTGIAPPLPASVYANPQSQGLLVKKRNALITSTVTAGVISAPVIVDGGVYDQVPVIGISALNGLVTAAATFSAPTMGGVPDTTRIYPG